MWPFLGEILDGSLKRGSTALTKVLGLFANTLSLKGLTLLLTVMLHEKNQHHTPFLQQKVQTNKYYKKKQIDNSTRETRFLGKQRMKRAPENDIS